MSAPARRLGVLRRVRTQARAGASRDLSAAREALEIAERAVAAAEVRAGSAAQRARSEREGMSRLTAGLGADAWRLREAWAARVEAERDLLVQLGEVLRASAGCHAESVEVARAALVTAHRSAEGVERISEREAARARQRRDRVEE
jgi:hypothetical protein